MITIETKKTERNQSRPMWKGLCIVSCVFELDESRKHTQERILFLCKSALGRWVWAFGLGVCCVCWRASAEQARPFLNLKGNVTKAPHKRDDELLLRDVVYRLFFKPEQAAVSRWGQALGLCWRSLVADDEAMAVRWAGLFVSVCLLLCCLVLIPFEEFIEIFIRRVWIGGKSPRPFVFNCRQTIKPCNHCNLR